MEDKKLPEMKIEKLLNEGIHTYSFDDKVQYIVSNEGKCDDPNLNMTEINFVGGPNFLASTVNGLIELMGERFGPMAKAMLVLQITAKMSEEMGNDAGFQEFKKSLHN